MANIELMNAMSSIGEGFLQGINRSKAAERQKMMDQMNMRHAEAKLDLSRQQLAQSGMNARNLDEYRRDMVKMEEKRLKVQKAKNDAQTQAAIEAAAKKQSKNQLEQSKLDFAKKVSAQKTALENEKHKFSYQKEASLKEIKAAFPDMKPSELEAAVADIDTFLTDAMMTDTGDGTVEKLKRTLEEYRGSLEGEKFAERSLDVFDTTLSQVKAHKIYNFDTFGQLMKDNQIARELGSSPESTTTDPDTGKLKPIKVGEETDVASLIINNLQSDMKKSSDERAAGRKRKVAEAEKLLLDVSKKNDTTPEEEVMFSGRALLPRGGSGVGFGY